MVAARALSIALEKVAAVGIAYVGVHNSNHFGAAAPYCLRAAEANKLLFMGTNASPAIAPFGGRDFKMGNNPIGFAAPRRSDPPFILDMALSVAAKGKMRRLRDAGEPMPAGWALDKDGNPSMHIPNDTLTNEVVSGFIGEGAAAELFSYLKVADVIPTIQEMLADPAKVKLPPGHRIGPV